MSNRRWDVRWRVVVTLAVGLTLISGVGLLDYLTGYEISFSVFYLIPTAFLAWRGGRKAGMFGALAAASVWHAVENASGHPYSQAWIMYWNTLVRLFFFVTTAELISRQRIISSLERKLSRTDGLTGLMNARSYFQEGERVRALCSRHERPMTLIYLDMDNFKQVNDTRGHREGDRLIQLVGQGLQRAARTSDLVARLGGDEFGLLLPETDFNDAEDFIGRLRQSLDVVVDRTYWRVGYSAGVITFTRPPADMEIATALADNLMYEVKRGGKDHWEHRAIDARATKAPVPG